jgi:type II secretory pathway pseudopilin PulG
MTMIEVLIVVMVASMVGLTTYQSISSALRVWERHQKMVQEEDILIFFHKLEQDARNIVPFSLIPMTGRQSRIAMPTTVFIPGDPQRGWGQGVYMDQLGLVEYYFDAPERSVYRRQVNYAQAINRLFGRNQKVLTDIDDFKIRYFFLTQEGVTYSSSVDNIIPAGIEVKVAYTDAYGRQEMEKIINIPFQG